MKPIKQKVKFKKQKIRDQNIMSSISGEFSMVTKVSKDKTKYSRTSNKIQHVEIGELDEPNGSNE